MDESKIAELKIQLDSQAAAIEEIRSTQLKIANALLGSFDKNSVGLLEEVRALRKESDLNNSTIQMYGGQINDLQTFRNDIKKIVAVIAVVIPIAFEVIKGSAGLFWDYLIKK